MRLRAIPVLPYLHKVYYPCAWDTHCGLCTVGNIVAGGQKDAMKSQNEQLSLIGGTDWLAPITRTHLFSY